MMISMAELLKSAAVIVLWHFFLFVVTKIRRARDWSSSLADAATNRPAGVTRFEYDVFLSFSGKDTRRGFTDHLYVALEQNGIRVFRDTEGLRKGDRIGETLLEAIQASAIAIPIFSRSYADSSWCLRELAAIMDCRRLVLPVFYDVEPTEVRHPEASENFKMAFKKHKKRFGEETVNQWKDAMREAAEASGYDSKSVVDGHEAKMIQMIVERVLRELRDWIPSKLPAPDIIGSTANGYCTRIIEHLKDPNVQKIGVWGMGGSGKTCIIKNVYNRLHEEIYGLFDHIILVSVPYECSPKDVRNEIGNQLLIRKLLDEENELKAAAFLKQRLYKKKFLLILDDLWRGIDLQELGVPEPTKENGCKILVTTRIHGVCNSMDTKKEVKVAALPHDEAWELFCHRAGELSEEILPIARRVTDACGGLPLAIVAVAESLRNQRDKVLWQHACGDLLDSRPLNQRMKEQVFDRLKMSYDRLETQALKDCFVSSVFYIDKLTATEMDLITYWVAEESIMEIQDDTPIGHPISDGIVLLSKLKEVCLLEECEDRKFVRMNEVTRSMALHMICGSRFMSENFPKTENAPCQEKWEVAEKISLRATKISSLSMNPNCSTRLTALLLHTSFRLNHISDSFFQHMESLRVLDLTLTELSCLPPSLSCLVNLRFLSLNFCQSLKSINHVGDLKHLLFLRLRGSAIEKLPKEISGLKKLRYLDLEGTIHLKEIESGAISELSALESLDMPGSAYVWSLEGTSTGASLHEIGHLLSNLKYMGLKVSSENDFEYIRETAIMNKSNDLYQFNCYIQESSKLMRFDHALKTWEGKVEEDPMLAQIASQFDMAAMRLSFS